MKINMKSKAALFIYYFEKDGEKMILNDSAMTIITRKDLEKALKEDEEKGIKHKIEYINKKPTEKVQFGVIYILHTPKGRPDYIYIYQWNG